MKTGRKEIEVIASFDMKGNARPIRFRIVDDRGEYQIIKVERIIVSETEKIAGNVMVKYRCQSLINGMEKIFEIKYECDTRKWYLFKM